MPDNKTRGGRMSEHQFVDAAPLVGVHLTTDNYMAASVRCGRTGLQTYLGSEFGMNDRETVVVYRPESEVFAADSLKTFAHRPVTVEHPSTPITADNWRAHAVGTVGDEVARDGEYVRVPMLLMDADAIKAVQDGKRELSLGYTTTLDMTPGMTPDGEPYDAVQKAIRVNHLAIVSKGRAGPEARIGDAEATKNWGISPINAADSSTTKEERQMGARTILVDGLQVETTDAGAAAIEKVTGERQAALDSVEAIKATAASDAAAAKTAADAAVAAKDAELAAKDAKIAELEAKVVTGDALDALVAARSALVAKAKLIAKDADFAGKSDHDVKAMAVAAARGPEFAADKSEAYIAVAFDMLDEPKGDTVAAVIASGVKASDTAVADNGYSDMKTQLANAYQLGSAA